MAKKLGAAEPCCAGTGISLSPEDALLIHCARIALSRQRCEAINDVLAAGIDWDLLIKKAAWHRLSPLVYYHLRSTDLVMLVPKPVLETMKSLYYLVRVLLRPAELKEDLQLDRWLHDLYSAN
jgi:hypothetical protein